ncbi:S-layer homology domain-containing protein [Candidatus Peregrinibacteria bacterium]|nr:S-layer homology domain-containing protein [Candidatus Peregrinibacteria bacterium]
MKKAVKIDSSYALSRKKGIVLLLALTLTSLSIGLTDVGKYLKISVIGFPEHDPYDGVVYPVQKVPNWVKLDSANWKYRFDELNGSDFVDLPFYDADQLKTSTDDLTWGDSEDDKIRIAKITYSVPYLGTYKFDGLEGTGSHPAVDIKIPDGTPIYAMANGTVIKASNQSSGFGHHIVLQHDNFPKYHNKAKFETLYSSYSHMGQLLVSEGDVVKKGEQIGTSGHTGTATTPHLHFQIDTSEAPWHPYWPFSWSEIADAGLSFFEAINNGFNQGNALTTTVNPMMYIQKYMDENVTYTDAEDEAEDEDEAVENVKDTESLTDTVNNDSGVEAVDDDSKVDEEVDEEIVIIEPEEPAVKPAALVFEFDVRSTYYAGKPSEFQINLRDQFGNVFADGFEGEVVVASFSGNFTAEKSIVGTYQFDKSGTLNNGMKMMKVGKDRVKVNYQGEVYYSDWFDIAESGSDPGFSDLKASNKYYDAIAYLVEKKVVNGYNDGTFKPQNAVNRVESLKFIYEGINERIYGGYLPFNDVDRKAWYGKYLYTAYDKGVVSGYSDGTFKPTQVVNKAEFYKLLLNGMGVKVQENVKVKPFEDVEIDSWYAPYVAYAKELKILDPDLKKFKPASGMTRGEVAYAIYRLMQVMK